MSYLNTQTAPEPKRREERDVDDTGSPIVRQYVSHDDGETWTLDRTEAGALRMSCITEAHASASQIETFRRCHMKWWWEKVVGTPRTDTPATLRGKAGHKQLERYLIDGTPPDGSEAGRLAAAALHTLPDPATVDPKDVERYFEFWMRPHRTSPERVKFIGYVDLIRRLPEDQAGIEDHKFKSSFRWAKSAEELLHDPQGIIYSNAMYGRPNLPLDLPFRHRVIRTKAPHQTRMIEAVFTKEHLRAGLDGLRKTVGQLIPISRLRQPQQLVQAGHYNTAACDDYRGCEHKHRCSRMGVPVPGAALTQFLHNQQPQQQEVPNVDYISEFFGAPSKPAPASTTPAQPAPASTTPAQPAPQHTEAASAHEAANAEPPPGINPPDGVPMDQPTELGEFDVSKVDDDNPTIRGKALKSYKKDETIALHTELLVEAAGLGLTDAYKAASQLPDGKRGRMDYQVDVLLIWSLMTKVKKAGSVASPAPAAAPTQQTAQSDDFFGGGAEKNAPAQPEVHHAKKEETCDTEQDKPVAPPQGAVGSILYFDCIATKGGRVQQLEDWSDLRKLIEQYEQHKQRHWAAVDFNKGDREIAEALKRQLASGTLEMPSEMVVLATGLGGSPFVRDVLREFADVVVQGVAR